MRPQFFGSAQWADSSRRLWLASVIGDWALAHELAQATGDAKLIAFTSKRAEECRSLQTEMAAHREQADRCAYAEP